MNSLWTDTTPSLLLFGGIFALCWIAVRIWCGIYDEWMRRRIHYRDQERSRAIGAMLHGWDVKFLGGGRWEQRLPKWVKRNVNEHN